MTKEPTRYKVIITIEDKSDTNIGVKMEFKPKLDMKSNGTNAVIYAMKILELLKEEKGKSLVESEDE